MNNIEINYTEVVNKINNQFQVLLKNEKYNQLSIAVGNEELFSKIEKEYNVYIVVKFTTSSFNFGQLSQNISLNVLGINNEIDLTQELLNDFVNTYNLHTEGGETQLYTTPSVALNFGTVLNGYKSLFTINGTLLIGKSTLLRLNTLKYWYDETHYEEIEVVSYNDITQNSLNPQVYANNKGRTKSYGTFQTFAFNIATYPDTSKQLIQKIYQMKYDFDNAHQNDSFSFSFVFETETAVLEFKCSAANFDQKIGEIPVISLSFTL